MLVCSAPILQNERVGPAVGTLVMARALDRASLTKLARETHVAFSLRDLERAEIESTPTDGSGASLVAFREQDEDTLIGSTVLRDIAGRPLRKIEARIPRSITAKGRAAIDTALFSVLASAALLLIALTVLLKHSVVGPLTRFTTNALRVGSREEIVAELELDRADEFGALSRRFAEMLTELARFHSQLADASHKAGMSEIATDVLHSVGNLLNSVQVSAGMVRERLDELSSVELSKVAALLRQKGPDLGRFIQEDAAGRRLPELLERLGNRLAEGREKALSECSALCSRIGDVADLVRAQQDLAGSGGVQENIDLTELIDLALTLTTPEQFGVSIDRDLAKLPRFCTDRHKLLQTLVNLLKNAVEAFEGVDRQDRRIRIAATEFGGGVRIAIEDNACGIAEDVLPQIFQHGFSTKPTGHGFGLHSVGVTVGALRGKIAVHSDGPGQGATFVIDLPLAREPSAAEPAASDVRPKRALSQKA